MTIINYASSVINKLEASLTDNSRDVIYNRHVFIVQAIDDPYCDEDKKSFKIGTSSPSSKILMWFNGTSSLKPARKWSIWKEARTTDN